MNEHIAYAMRNTEARQSFISFNHPLELLDWSFLAVELMMLVGILCAIAHAIKEAKKQDHNGALLTLFACFYYGILMDMFGYYGPESFWHGEFTVMFLYNRLPLYIALFYPAFMYHAYMTIRRYEFSPIVEAMCVGFYSGITYQLFDNLGPQLGWWIWDPEHTNNHPFLNNVPVISYQWFCIFSAAFALIARYICWEWPKQGASKLKIGIGIAAFPFLIFALGTPTFIPFKALIRNDMSELAVAIYVLILSVFGFVFLINYRRPALKRDTLLMIFPLVFLIGHLYLYIAKFDQLLTSNNGLTASGLPIGNLLAVTFGLATSLAILLFTHPVDNRSQA